MATFPEWVTVDEARARYPDELDDDTDATVRLQLDQVTSAVEQILGHAFGRAAYISSTAADTVEVTATDLIVGGDTYTLADYTTLVDLMVAVNAGGGDYSMELLPVMRPDTSPAYLRTLAQTACGPTYDLRQVLSVSHMYYQGTGGQSHFYLPLPLYSINEVIESATVLTSTNYWAQVGSWWIIRKYCNCATSECYHPLGRWKATYPGNLLVYFLPVTWLNIPAQLAAAVMEAFGAMRDIGSGSITSESFLSYSYTKGKKPTQSWQDMLAASGANQYAVKPNYG